MLLKNKQKAQARGEWSRNALEQQRRNVRMQEIDVLRQVPQVAGKVLLGFPLLVLRYLSVINNID